MAGGGLLLLLILLVVSPFLIVRLGSVRESLLRAGGERLGLGPDERLRVGRVERFDPLHVSLAEVAFETRDSLGWQPVTSAKRVRLVWSARRLLSGALGVRSFEVDSLRIWLPRLAALGPAGGVEESPPEQGGGGLALPRLSVDRLAFRGMGLIDASGLRVAGDLELAEVVSAGETATGEVVAGRLRAPSEQLEARFRDGRLFVQRDRLIELRGLQVAAEDSRFVVRVRKDLSNPETPMRLNLAADLIGPALLERLLPAFLQPEVGDSLSGTVELWFGRGHWLGDASLAGRLVGEEVAGISGLVELGPDTLRVNNLWLAGA